MTNTALVLLAVISCVVAVTGKDTGASKVEGVRDAATGWRRISVRSDGFTVLMPVAATVQSDTSSSPPQRYYNAETAKSIFMIGITDMTAELSKNDFPNTKEVPSTLFDSAEEGMLKGLGDQMDLRKLGPTKVGTADERLYGFLWAKGQWDGL